MAEQGPKEMDSVSPIEKLESFVLDSVHADV